MSDSLGWQMSRFGVFETAKIVKTRSLYNAGGLWNCRTQLDVCRTQLDVSFRRSLGNAGGLMDGNCRTQFGRQPQADLGQRRPDLHGPAGRQLQAGLGQRRHHDLVAVGFPEASDAGDLLGPTTPPTRWRTSDPRDSRRHPTPWTRRGQAWRTG